MDLTPGQQRLVFVVVVVAFAGLGIYLIGGRHTGTSAPAAPASASPAAAPTASAGQSSAAAASAAATSVPPATVPPPTPIPTVAGGADIYEWLPFTQADLTAAAKTTLAFATEYVTWSYTETKAAYGGKLAPLATSQEVTTLEYYYSTAGVASQRAADKQVSTGSGTISSITSFGASPTSITFQVSIAQRLASTTGTKRSTSQYAITVVSTGGNWRVNSIELSKLGNS